MIIGREQLKKIVATLRRNKKKIVTTNGVFDILHLGHIHYLENAKKLGDILIIGVNSDHSTKKLKGETRPINTQKDRAALLNALRVVDYVVIFPETDPRNFLSLIQPDIHVKGGDYTIDQIIEKDVVEAGGGTVILLETLGGYATTKIIQKIQKDKGSPSEEGGH